MSTFAMLERRKRKRKIGRGPRWEGNKQVKTEAKVNEFQLVASICKESFYEFVKEFWSTVIPERPVWNWHLRYLCREAQKVAERVFKGERKEYDLVVNIPPGTTKSTILSVMLPAWLWTRMPSARFIGASYAYPLAMDLSRKCRDVITSDKYRACFPEIVLREDQNTKGYYQNTLGGFRYAVGVNGSVTGMHAHLIVIDDPLDPNQSVSPAELKSANHWIKETLPTRKVDKRVTPTILVMQRLHQDDPTSIFLKKRRVKHINLPAQARDKVVPSVLRKFYKNGLLDATRMPKSVLKEALEDLGAWGYAAQYRQNPVPRGGGMFKVGRIKVVTSVPTKWKKLVRYWDKAGTKSGGAYTVGTKIGVDLDGRFWVLDVIRGQWDSYERERVIEHAAESDGYKTLVVVEQEPGSGGKESAENTVRRLAGFRVKMDKVDITTGGKVVRADPWSVQVNAGNVYVVEGCDWFEDWKEEHRYFPNSKYKDQVDSASGAFAHCHKRRIRVGGMVKTKERLVA